MDKVLSLINEFNPVLIYRENEDFFSSILLEGPAGNKIRFEPDKIFCIDELSGANRLFQLCLSRINRRYHEANVGIYAASAKCFRTYSPD